MSIPRPHLAWIESSATGILVQEPDLWHSGKVVDLTEVGDGRLLVGSESGGVWIVEPDGNARPVSHDWDHPNVLCLVKRRGTNDTFLCGTKGGLFINEPKSADPLGMWHPVDLPDGVSDVHRVVALNDFIVIATNNGIWWARFGNDVGAWHLALRQRLTGDVVPCGHAWSGLASTDNGQIQFAAGTAGSPPSDPTNFATLATRAMPLIFGKFDGKDLVFTGASLPIPDSDLSLLESVSIAACDALPNNVYAAVFQRGKVFGLLQSTDCGRTWENMPNLLLAGPPHVDYSLDQAAGNNEAGGPIKTISVHPTLPRRVGFSGYISFVWDDGVGKWTPIGAEWTTPKDGIYTVLDTPQNVHVDHHTLLFAPTADGPERVYVATDGGVFQAQDWHDAPAKFVSLYNRGLRTLQFYSASGYRSFLGSLSSTPSTRGISVGGLQDNGNVWKPDNTTGVWRKTDDGDGDGGYNVVLPGDRYLHQIHFGKFDANPDGAVQFNTWSVAGTLDAAALVPVRDTEGNQTAAFLKTPLEPVREPAFRNADGQLLHALGWRSNMLFGFFGDDDGGNPYWLNLVSLPNAEDSIWTASSYNGAEVLIATESNRVYRLNSSNGDLREMSLNALPDINLDGAKPKVNRLVATGPDDAFASFINPKARTPSVARRNGDAWEVTASPPDDPLSNSGTAWGMDADDVDNPPLLLVATESRVWASGDRGDTWSDVSEGLPRQPHCTDLRFNRYKRRWMLGSWGRSLWQAGKLVQVGVSSLIQSDFIRGAEHHNFEALVLLGDELFHYFKDNRNPGNRWTRKPAPITRDVTAPACIIRSDWVRGAEHHNFEALVLKGNELTHWSCDNSADGFPWKPVSVIPVAAIGPASMIQSDYYMNDDHGNYEALIPTADGLWHWYRNNETGEWAQRAQVTPRVGSVGCITSSDYENDPGHRAMEALVFEPHEDDDLGVLSHFYWNPAQRRWIWTRSLTDMALGPAPLIQSDYIKGKAHCNLEAIVWRRENGLPVLRHFWRRDDIGSLDWVCGAVVSSRAQGPASMIRSDFHSDPDHDNFEAIYVDLDNELWHEYRDQSTVTWIGGGTVT